MHPDDGTFSEELTSNWADALQMRVVDGNNLLVRQELATPAQANPALVPSASAIKAPAALAEANHLPVLAFDEISENVVALVQQQRLPEAIARWQRVVDAFSAPGSADQVARENKEHAIALRGRAMLHRLNDNANAALADIARACSLDAREKLAKLPARSSLTWQLRWNVLQGLQSPEMIGVQPKAPLAAAMQYQREAESYAAEDRFVFAKFEYRKAFDLRLKNLGAAHADTKQTAWRMIELIQMTGSEFATNQIAEIEKQMVDDPKVLIAAKSSVLKNIVVSPRQGAFVFTASEPVLQGQRQYATTFCGTDQGSLGNNFRDDDMLKNVTFQKTNADGTFALQLLVRDGKDNFNYRFSDVRPGESKQASLEGNCALPHVQVVYRPTRSKLCVSTHKIYQPIKSIVHELVRATGISLQGIELLGNERLTLVMDLTARRMLKLMADFTGLELEKIDETYFAFHAAATGKSD